jgi:uncharacterized protein (DUF169 family)
MPSQNFHVCDLTPKDRYDRFSRVLNARNHNGKKYDVVYGHNKKSGEMEDHAFYYNKNVWSASEASAHCKDHKGNFGKAEDEAKQSAIIKDAEMRYQKHIESMRR